MYFVVNWKGAGVVSMLLLMEISENWKYNPSDFSPYTKLEMIVRAEKKEEPREEYSPGRRKELRWLNNCLRIVLILDVLGPFFLNNAAQENDRQRTRFLTC